MTTPHPQRLLEQGGTVLAKRHRLLISAIAAVLLGLVVAAASAASQARTFDAHFNDRACGTGKLCGTGVVTGFGAVTSELTFGPAASPAPGCFGAKGTRALTLAKDAASTLRLAVQGAVCGSRSWGTFKVVSGTGAFVTAKGSGVIWGARDSEMNRRKRTCAFALA
jgi:hypothetical protein